MLNILKTTLTQFFTCSIPFVSLHFQSKDPDQMASFFSKLRYDPSSAGQGMIIDIMQVYSRRTGIS